MPQKTWVIGEEVLATDFNAYVQNQVVPRFATVAARDAAWPAATAGVGAVCTTQDTGITWVARGTPVAWVPQSLSVAGGLISLGSYPGGTVFPAGPEDLTVRLLNNPLIYDATGCKYAGLYTLSFVFTMNTSATGYWVTYVICAASVARSQTSVGHLAFAVSGGFASQRLNVGEKIAWQSYNTTAVGFTNVSVALTLAYTP